MTSAEAQSIIQDILKDQTRLWRTKHFNEVLEEREYTIQDVWKILRRHVIEREPIWDEAAGNFEVSLRGTSLDGRDTRLILGIRPYGPSSIVTIVDVKGRGRKR